MSFKPVVPREPGTVKAAIARLEVPRLGLDMVVVDGTDGDTLRKGPARDRRTFMPGQGELVYVAGHRTTYGAPFAEIFERYNRDFYKVDPGLFSPAVIVLCNLKSGRRHVFGRLEPGVLRKSFGG